MAPTDLSEPILIVGAGPVGLLAALLLTQNGVPVRIIEKNVTPRVGTKGAGLHPRTLELYSIAGILPEVLAAGIWPIASIKMYNKGALQPMKIGDLFVAPEKEPSVPFNTVMMFSQDRHEAFLREQLARHGVQVEKGTVLVGLQQDADGVTVTMDKGLALNGSTDNGDIGGGKRDIARFQWVMGTDGGRGTVRKLLGLTFLGETTQERFVVGDVRVEGLSNQFWHTWTNDAQTATLTFRPSEKPDVYMIAVQGEKLDGLPEKEDVDTAYLAAHPDALIRWAHQMIGHDEVQVIELISVAHYTPNVRMVNKFSQGRVFVAGDAAHIHTPQGGQGLNSGVQDVFNLAWKLSVVHKGLAAPALLDTYSEERGPVIAHMLNITTKLMAATAERFEQTFNRHPHFLMLGVNYRRSRLSINDAVAEQQDAAEHTSPYFGGEDLRAGDRAPEAPGLRVLKCGSAVLRLEEGDVTSMLRVFRAVWHTVLVFFGAAVDPSMYDIGALTANFPVGTATTAAVLPKGKVCWSSGDDVDIILEDTEGHAFEGYRLDAKGGMQVLIVRPDGYIGAFVDGPEGVQRYTMAVFGA